MPGFRLLVIALSTLFALVNSHLAHCWDFSLSGQTSWTYEYYTQTGRNGFFGPYDVDRGYNYPFNNTHLFNRNFWYGIPRVVDQNVASGSDAAVSYLYMTFLPEIRVNNAIKLRAQYNIGGWNDSLGEMFSVKDSTPYLTDTAFGTRFAMASGHWTMYWADIQSPWGKLTFGKRPRTFGVGLQYDGVRTATSESVFFTSYYGPLTIGLGFYPYRLALPARDLANYQIQMTFNPSVPFYGSSYDGSGNSNWYNQWTNSLLNKADKSATNKVDIEGYLKYSGGPIELGIFAGYFDYHVGSEWLQDFRNSYYTYYSSSISYTNIYNYHNVALYDSQICHGSVYGKYFDGRYFLNLEAAWLYTSDTTIPGYIPIMTGSYSYSPTVRTSYVEQWRYAIESGLVAGPAKLSLLYAFSPGLDRRGGSMLDKQPSAILRHPSLTRQFAGVSLWRQYAYILPYTYNTGLPNVPNNTADPSFQRLDSPNKEGQLLDAIVLAGRLDWALAANLNLFATYLWAHRASQGYGWGSISLNPSSFYGANNGQHFWTPYKIGNVITYPPGQYNYLSGAYSPTIPETSLGYEIDAGIDWKILENMEVNLLVGRWQPGSWFSYACIDRSVPYWNDASQNSTFFGTRPNKIIDPIWATRVGVSINF